MLFSSYVFVLGFLPLLLSALLLAQKADARVRMYILIFASLVFYGWNDWRYVGLLLGSSLTNFLIAQRINATRSQPQTARLILAAGIVFNLALLGYFKYADFLISTANQLTGAQVSLLHVVLPIGISFFTFQQIAYLVDVSKGDAPAREFLPYLLFLDVFPHLIAGPIVHHKLLRPQIEDGRAGVVLPKLVAKGSTLFIAGLIKKVVIADQVALWSTPVFSAAASGVPVPLLESWAGALAYTFQIYFDFSGYSDMAIGLGLMIGLRLPLNFNSPYKAASLIDFWRRWHISLSVFLRDYLYIPIGGSRLGTVRRYCNLAIVMLLGGLWHGANWTFVVWGGLHGLGLIVNHVWRDLKMASLPRIASMIFTFIFVVVCWVPFRASSMQAAANIWRGMIGANGVVLPVNYEARLGSTAGWARSALGIRFEDTGLFFGAAQILAYAVLLAFVWILPNTIQVIRYQSYGHSGDVVFTQRSLAWQPNAGWALASGMGLLVCLFYMSRGGEFLYYAF